MFYVSLLLTGFLAAVMYLIGAFVEKQKFLKRIHKVSDVFKPKSGSRTKNQLQIDKIMQLTNEIAKSGALKEENLKNSEIRLTLSLYKDL